MFRAFLPAAIRLRVPLLAPTFDEERFRGYQRLGGAEGPLAALEAMMLTLADAESCFDLDVSAVDLFGYSGGAQFAHRLPLLEPRRCRRVVVASAGWYTMLDATRRFPHGTAPGPHSAGRTPDVRGFLGVPLHVLVGEHDVERDAALRAHPGLDRRQGRSRLTRALRWVDHVEDVARRHGVPTRIMFDLLPDSGHSLSSALFAGGLVERTMAFLHEPAARVQHAFEVGP